MSSLLIVQVKIWRKIFKHFLSFCSFFFSPLPSKFGYFIQKHEEYAKEYSLVMSPPPHSGEISRQKKEKLLPAAVSPFFRGGEILHMPASGLGEKSTLWQA